MTLKTNKNLKKSVISKNEIRKINKKIYAQHSHYLPSFLIQFLKKLLKKKIKMNLRLNVKFLKKNYIIRKLLLKDLNTI